MRMLVTAVALILAGSSAWSQQMPAESRSVIHTLLSNHETITRSMTLTEDGYIATTESSDPEVRTALRDHVKQMSERIESGLMVRRWDPAFEEYVAHAGQIEHTMEATENGIRMLVRGKTPEAIKVAQNHAAVVTDFVNEGWTAHDRTHAPVLPTTETSSRPGCCGDTCRGRHGHGEK